jgi:drug/metabolite transporter (DMT)-like permease
MLLVVLYFKNSDTFRFIKTSVRNPFILGAGITQQLGAILLNVGLSGDNAGGSIVVALSACYPVLTTIMAFYFFKERIPLAAVMSGALAIAGIVILSI